MLLKKGLRHQVGDGKSIRIWESPWIGVAPGFKVCSQKPANCSLTWVNELMSTDGKEWNLQLIQELFLPHEANWICQQPISQLGSRDRLVWNPTKNGHFSVKSAYDLQYLSQAALSNRAEGSTTIGQVSSMWSKTWKLNIKRKIQHFLWRCITRSLPTADQLKKKGVELDPICKLCGEGDESIEHIFFQCSLAEQVWNLSLVQWNGLKTHEHSFADWWMELCQLGNQAINQDRIEYSAYLLWNLWKNRNDWHFNNSRKSILELIENSQAEWLEFKSIQAEPYHTRIFQQVQEEQPDHQNGSRLNLAAGYITLSVSAAKDQLSGQVGFGISARTSNGRLIAAWAEARNSCLSSVAAAWAAIRAAQLKAYHWGWKHIVIQIDVKNIVTNLEKGTSVSTAVSTFFNDINLLKFLFEDCSFKFIHRLQNLGCFKLALHAIEFSRDCSWNSNFPDWL